MYIVIEGQDGTGKTTQVELLAEYFRKQGRQVVILNEGAENNSGLKSTDDINRIHHIATYHLEANTNLALFSAQRCQLWHEVALPTLAKGGVVLAARNWWSTLAYQGYGQGADLDIIENVTREIVDDERYMTPDASVILVLDDETRAERLGGRDNRSKNDTFESKGDDFQSKVNAGYLKIADKFQVPTIDASGTPEQIHAEITKHL